MNPKSAYQPVCFVDIDKGKVGREIYGIPVIEADESVGANFAKKGVQEVVFALPSISNERRMELYTNYSSHGYKIKTYDYPTL